jgi:type I restriction enzyme M protein
MDPAEYKHTVLGLIFLKYISDSFDERYNELKKQEYSDPRIVTSTCENIFWVPRKSRWGYIRENAKKPDIGQKIDDAMV